MSNNFKTARIEASRHAILDAADACVRAGSPLQIGTVAEEAGIAVGTVYRYFEDKQHLEDELVARMLVSMTRNVEAVLEPAADAERRLDLMLRAICDAALDHCGALRLFLEQATWSQLGTDHEVADEAKRAYLRYCKLEQDALKRLGLKPAAREAAVFFLRASVMAGLVRLANSSAADREKGIEGIIRLTTRGLLGCAD